MDNTRLPVFPEDQLDLPLAVQRKLAPPRVTELAAMYEAGLVQPEPAPPKKARRPRRRRARQVEFGT